MAREPGLFRSGEVDFKLRPSRCPPECYETKRPARPTKSPSGGLILFVLVFLAVMWLCLNGCGKQCDNGSVAVQMNGKQVCMKADEAQSMAAFGETYSWDFTKVKHPDEGLWPAPQETKTK